jgi:membrane protein insertase Oxa1/YidC/SpoIIIJ
MLWIGTQIPIAVCFYWAVSSLFGVAQNLTFRVPAVRRAAGIPLTPTESQRPFGDIASRLRDEWRGFLADLKRNRGL